jgi:hypothetical protein
VNDRVVAGQQGRRRIPPSRGLISASMNVECETLLAMGIEGVDEREVYRSLMLEDYPGEYGERPSAKRRGYQFEDRLRVHNGALLKERVAPVIGKAAGDIYLRDFVDEMPGPVNAIHATRLMSMRRIFEDVRDGRLDRVPDIMVQPTLALHVLDGPQGSFYISPDMLVFDARTKTFRVGEFKSFIVRRKNVDPTDLDKARRQTAAGILALADELARVGLAIGTDTEGLFIFARPNGLQAHDPIVEQLRAEISEVDRARRGMREVAKKLATLRSQVDSENLADLIPGLTTNYREGCVATCLLARWCEKEQPNNPAVFGDVGKRVLGDTDLARLSVVLRADRIALSPAETAVQQTFQDSAVILGCSYEELLERIA